MKLNKAFDKIRANEEGYSGTMMCGKDMYFFRCKVRFLVKSVSYRLVSKDGMITGTWESGEEEYTGPLFAVKKDKEMVISFRENDKKEYIFDAEERESCRLYLSYKIDDATEQIIAEQGKGMYLTSDMLSASRDTPLREVFLQMAFKAFELMEDENEKR